MEESWTWSRHQKDLYIFGGNWFKALERDGYKCVKCGMTNAEHMRRYNKHITVDHIDGMGTYVPKEIRNNSLDNLQTMCLPCHRHKDIKPHKLYKIDIFTAINIMHLKGSMSGAKVGSLYGLHRNYIYQIWKGKRWNLDVWQDRLHLFTDNLQEKQDD